ncbi:MAG: M1 family peptidase [Chitinophagaceae bacterium]|nr:MAG: M1 family peptidase [Chitinophagaceae bacterium]
MKRISLLICTMLTTLLASAQYWQQQTDYVIDVFLDDKAQTLKGNVYIEYTNNSPDELPFIWFHLWQNAYKNDRTAFARQLLRDKDGKARLKGIKDKGSIEDLAFTVEGKTARMEPDPENIDIVKLVLPEPLKPGKKIILKTWFTVHIPTYASRSGRLGQAYLMCQWYPKPAVYDRKGWHPMPYLDQGEFYSDFGNFTVNISVPSSYVVGATGQLQNEDELAIYKKIGANNLDSARVLMKYTPAGSNGTKILTYKASRVHDFAWFADKDFIIRYDTAQLSAGTTIDVFTYGYENGTPSWKNSVSFIEDAIRHYSNWLGEYPYPVAQAVEGPQNVSSGGMEYPMITLITSPGASNSQMDGVITHEVGHNWFYGILGSNERDHAWMDEGLNSYFQFRYEAEKYRTNSIFGDAIPPEVKAKPLKEFESTIYAVLSGQIPMEEAIETPAADFADKDKYAMVEYIKTAVWMYIIEQVIGRDKVDAAFKEYYNDWKFKHPYPEDLKEEFRKQSPSNIDGLWQLLDKKGKFE